MDDFAHIVGEDVHFRGRSPSGERGLKFGLVRLCGQLRLSLPIRGAWIEIFTPLNEEEESQRRSPSGERGLKSQAIRQQRSVA